MVPYNYIKEFIEKPIRTNWDKNALSDYKGKTLTYKEVGQQIHYLHELFRNWEIKPGDKIALIGRNNSNWGVIYLATISYGAVIVPILTDFSPSDIHHIVNHSDSILLFVGETIWGNLDTGQMPNLRAIFSTTDFQELTSQSSELSKKFSSILPKLTDEIQALTPEKISYPNIGNELLGEISYTSGTTGFSKGVMLSLNSLAANVDFGRKNIGLVAGDSIVSFLPLAHAFGCAFEFLMPFAVGCHITFLTKVPSPKIILEAFAAIKPRLVLSVPLIIEKIYKKQIQPQISKPLVKLILAIPLLNKLIYSKINRKLSESFGGNFLEIVIGGAALNHEVERFLRKINFRYTVGYGMTECGPLISYSGWKSTRKRSCGKVINYLEVKIDSDNPYKIPGEILIRGENVMEGYYKNPEDTSKTLIDGWLHSGDLGIFDKKGFLYIKGRSKSMILGPSGQNIYPEIIEAKLNNLPFIQESLVIEEDGKLIGLIYPDFESIEQESVPVHELEPILDNNLSELNRHLPQYCRLTKLKVHDREFEKTPKKSIKRYLYQISKN